MSFVLTEPDRDRLNRVRLWQEVRIPADALDFDWSDGPGGWRSPARRSSAWSSSLN
ncbi:MAG: hypothetical protein ABJA87_04100 [bacterium]